MKKLTLLLKLRSYKQELSENILKSYICEQIIVLMTSGIYSVKSKLPDEFSETLAQLISCSNNQAFEKFTELLKKTWLVEKPEDYIIALVSELLKNFENYYRKTYCIIFFN